MRLDSPKQNLSSKVRLQKYLALCGVGSRRACEACIDQGRVAVDGLTIEGQGLCIDPETSTVTVDGHPVRPQQKVYLCLNKPRDVLCTSRDTHDRKTFLDLLPDIPERVYTVGRLDRDSEGLLLVTNDGELAVRLTHPRYHMPKTYHVWLDKPIDANQQRQLLIGITDDDELLTATRIAPLPNDKSRFPAYEIILNEGKNRQLRRMFQALDRRVKRLLRVRIGPLTLGTLKKGQWRTLTPREIQMLNTVRS